MASPTRNQTPDSRFSFPLRGCAVELASRGFFPFVLCLCFHFFSHAKILKHILLTGDVQFSSWIPLRVALPRLHQHWTSISSDHPLISCLEQAKAPLSSLLEKAPSVNHDHSDRHITHNFDVHVIPWSEEETRQRIASTLRDAIGGFWR